LSTHTFFLSGWVVETREFCGTALASNRVFPQPARDVQRALACVLLILGTASTAKQTGSAVERFQSLQVKLRESHSANDWRSNLVSANELKELLNEAQASLLEIARADVHVDDLKAAFRELELFARMGQSTDLLATSLL
jgi:hypothetical protein